MTDQHIFGAILAGGEGRRLGGRKALALLDGAPLAAHVARVLRRDVVELAVVGDTDAALLLQAVALSDPPEIAKGPLAGVLAGLTWARAGGASWLATAPCDAPLLPDDLIARLKWGAEQAGAPAAHALTSDGAHPLCALWATNLLPRFQVALRGGAHPPVHRLAAELGAARVLFDDAEAFLNVNTPEDLARAEAILTHRAHARRLDQ